MKVSIGMRLREGPWGGGNQVGWLLAGYLQRKGVHVRHDLNDGDLDIILLADPNPRSETSAFTHKEIARYLLTRNRRALVVHRINNTSEARHDPRKAFNNFRVKANRAADHTVFVSQWTYERYRESGFARTDLSVIYNGGHVGERVRRTPGRRSRRLRLVTHHWSTNPQKGFDVYRRLDDVLASESWAKKLAFTYVGRLPNGFDLRFSTYVAPKSGQDLMDELRCHDAYLTASQNESAGMHHIEAALCGLPILYRESGANPEYCSGFGIGFTQDNFENKLEEFLECYDTWAAKMPDYPYTADRMGEEYYQLFERLLDRREEILKRRSLLRLARMAL